MGTIGPEEIPGETREIQRELPFTSADDDVFNLNPALTLEILARSLPQRAVRIGLNVDAQVPRQAMQTR